MISDKDTIYRQEAINAIKTWGLIDGLSEGQAIEILADKEKLPSAQPERRWIPVSERLPEDDGSYWVCGRWGSGKIAVGDCEYSTEDRYFQTAWNFDVLAWMPLPEPYQEGEQK